MGVNSEIKVQIQYLSFVLYISSKPQKAASSIVYVYLVAAFGQQ